MGDLCKARHGSRTAAGRTLAMEEAMSLWQFWVVAARSEETVSRPRGHFSFESEVRFAS